MLPDTGNAGPNLTVKRNRNFSELKQKQIVPTTNKRIQNNIKEERKKLRAKASKSRREIFWSRTDLRKHPQTLRF